MAAMEEKFQLLIKIMLKQKNIRDRGCESFAINSS
jgi:hypothetical protein